MWGKVSFHRTRKPSGENHPPTDSPVYQSTPRAVSHSRDLSSKALPTLPSGPPNSHFTAHQPEPNPRVASSIYSRDTVVFDHPRQRSISDTYRLSRQYNPPGSDHSYSQGTRSVDISPPDSPITRIRSRSSSRVSPIEDEPPQVSQASGDTPTGSKFASHIPILRKRVDSQPDRLQPMRPPIVNATRWDDFSGERTTGRQGRIGQATPGSVSFETHVSAAPPPSHSSKIFGWGKDQLSSRKKLSEPRNRFYGSDEATPFAPREPWKGQSGRAPTVAPIQEKPRNRSSSRLRLSRSYDRLREMNTPSPVSGIVRPSTVTTIITASTENHKQEPRRNPYDAREAEGNASAVSGNAPPRVDILSGPELSVGLTDLRLAENDVNEPTSRFSVTTYDPTEVGSPTPSPRHSITPSPPPSIIDTASQSSGTPRSVMSRARPVPSTIAPGKRPVRKPTPSEIPLDKALPQNPAELTAQGRIEMLEAKRNDLIRRRTNINTIIHELTQVIQPSSIAYDMAAREEVKKTVTSLNNELAEIKKEEHEIGLKLLRAWKKRADEDFYGQSSSLWVKRVTS
ncbi:hypothetical protein BDW59DRAFT_59947 [Aspergillus cavernicola]|uniref:BHLH domain-containing protein n=1 Tax=Aspergillus cavernicola TaxID=176166 RepID=A0ABR4IJS4_9EURO